jgi:hypothetical protein
MTEKNIAVFGIYPHRASFEYAFGVLKEQGFRDTDVSVLLQENSGTKDLATQKATKAPEGVATGADSGAVIGGALSIPTLGPLLVAGPIIPTLAGIGVGGTLGGVSRALIGLGTPYYEAKRYQGRIEKGGSFYRCTAIVQIGRIKPNACSILLERRIFHRVVSLQQTMTIQTVPCLGILLVRSCCIT